MTSRADAARRRNGSGHVGPGRASRARAAAAALPDVGGPLHARLRDWLRGEILEGRLAPHAQLPSEAELSERFGMSRITVRQALAALTVDGLIVKVQGKGSFVSAPRVAQQLDRLTGLAEGLAERGTQLHARVLKLRDVEAPRAIAERLGLDPKAQVTELLSLRYLDREPLCLSHSYLRSEVGARLRSLDVAHRDLIDLYERELGIAVGRAEIAIRATTVGKRERKPLAVGEEAPVLQVERLVFDAADRPLHLEESVYRSETFSYRLTLAR